MAADAVCSHCRNQRQIPARLGDSGSHTPRVSSNPICGKMDSSPEHRARRVWSVCGEHWAIFAMASKRILTIHSALGSIEVGEIQMWSVWVEQLASALSATKGACAVSLHHDHNELTQDLVVFVAQRHDDQLQGVYEFLQEQGFAVASFFGYLVEQILPEAFE